MVQTRSMTTSPKHPKAGDAFSHPNRIPNPPLASVQQQLQFMAVAVMELTQKNQDLTKEVHKKKHRQHRHADQEEPRRNPKERKAKSGVEGEDQSRSTVTRRVLHLVKEVDQMETNEGLYENKNTCLEDPLMRLGFRTRTLINISHSTKPLYIWFLNLIQVVTPFIPSAWSIIG